MTVMIHRTLDNLPAAARGHSVAIGNFDGLHLGHQRVIAAALGEAGAAHDTAAVLTFSPSPRQFFQPSAPPSELMPIAARARALAEYGVSHLFVQTFDEAFSHLSPQEFVEHVLAQQLGARRVVVGENFHFGYRRAGNVDTLRIHAQNVGIEVISVPAARAAAGEVYSSTRVRELLSAGDVDGARKILTRPFEVEALVQHGDHVASGLGFHTANLRMDSYHRPRYGVYAVRVQLPGEAQWRDAVANLGIRPTLDGQNEWLEVHVFGLARDLYGQTVRVRFYDFIRPEQRFTSLDVLKAQIKNDIAESKKRLE